MFPLTNKEPYIKSSGERTTLGDMFAQAGGDISELEQEVDELNEALTDEVETRAALGAHNLFPFVYNKDTWVDSGTSKVESGGVVTYTATGTYARVGYWYPNLLEIGRRYKIQFKKKCTISATSRIQLASTQTWSDSDPSVIKTFSYLTSDADYVAEEYEFTATSKDFMFGVYVQASNSSGNIVALKEVQIVLATDSDPTYQPYAMTNKELTDVAQEVAPLLGNGSTRAITSLTSMSDLDNGIYSMPASDSSIFDGYSKLILVFKYGTNSGLQIAYRVRNNADVSANLAFRYCWDGTYLNWSIISATNQT